MTFSRLLTGAASFDERYSPSETARLAERERIIKNIAPNAEFTGMARRVTFNPTFIAALQKSLADAQVNLMANNLGAFGGAGRIYTDYSSYAMGVNPQQNAFSYTGRQQQPHNGYVARNRVM